MGLKCSWKPLTYDKGAQVSHTRTQNSLAKNRATNKSLKRARKKSWLSPAIHYLSRSPMISFSICCSLPFIQRALFRGVCQIRERRILALSCNGQILFISALHSFLYKVKSLRPTWSASPCLPWFFFQLPPNKPSGPDLTALGLMVMISVQHHCYVSSTYIQWGQQTQHPGL